MQYDAITDSQRQEEDSVRQRIESLLEAERVGRFEVKVSLTMLRRALTHVRVSIHIDGCLESAALVSKLLEKVGAVACTCSLRGDIINITYRS